MDQNRSRTNLSTQVRDLNQCPAIDCQSHRSALDGHTKGAQMHFDDNLMGWYSLVR